MGSPRPLVKKPRLRKQGPIDPGVRVGRGFSIGELKVAGIDLRTAKRLGLYVDRRRKSVHEWNVELLKRYISGSRGSKSVSHVS